MCFHLKVAHYLYTRSCALICICLVIQWELFPTFSRRPVPNFLRFSKQHSKKLTNLLWMLAAARIRMPFICAYCCRNLYITECKYKQIHMFLNNNYINYFYVNVTTNNFSKMYTSILYILIYKVCPKNNRTVWIENKMHIILSLKVIIYSR